jgi:hypothetical protein
MFRKVWTAISGVSAPSYIWRTVPIGSFAWGYAVLSSGGFELCAMSA